MRRKVYGNPCNRGNVARAKKACLTAGFFVIHTHPLNPLYCQLYIIYYIKVGMAIAYLQAKPLPKPCTPT